MKAGAQIITEGRLRLSRSPTADLAACALQAQEDAGLEGADFIIIAVEPGGGSDKLGEDLKKAAAAATKPPKRAK